MNNLLQESTMNKTQRAEPYKKRRKLSEIDECLSQFTYNLRPRDRSLSQMSTTSKVELYVPLDERVDLSPDEKDDLS